MDPNAPEALTGQAGPDRSVDTAAERQTGERITLAELARRAGVSKATVSRALNGKPDVDAQTRQRILTLVAATGYSPDPVARALRGLSPLSAEIAPPFPADFLWGIGTSAYQIEGAVDEDGRGQSIWDDFARLPGAIARGETATVAADHYHRWREDVALLATLGVRAYRFSVAWPRVLPEGAGKVNTPGLDFYDRLVDALLAHGITPLVTLYHWDLPAALQRRGGWLNRDTAEAFAIYAEVVARRLGDRVEWWVTHNEPWVVAYLGHALGSHAPGIADMRAAVTAGHHLLLSHGLAVARLRGSVGSRAQLGITLNLSPIYAADAEAETLEQVHAADLLHNQWLLQPLFEGRYTPDVFSSLRVDAPPILDGDMELIAAPLDFLGVNYYERQLFRTPTQPATVRKSPQDGRHAQLVVPVPGASYTEMGWEIYPQGLEDMLAKVYTRYHPRALLVTENGAAFSEADTPSNEIHDEQRIAYLRDHIQALSRSRQRGMPVRGYFAWTLLDNFEWTSGYQVQFGLVAVDPRTLERRIKASGKWYASFIRQQTAPHAGATR
jgi:beta-glucosidase